jgi:hypothetical protein
MTVAKKRLRPKLRAKYRISSGPHGPSCILFNSRGRVVNAINGGKNDTEEDVRRAARKWFPDAREVK